MAKVYSPPAELMKTQPKWDTQRSFDLLEADEERWVKSIQDYAKKHGKGKYRGEEIDFPAGDGAARYVVFTNTSLIHLPVGDAWQFRYAHLLTGKEIAKHVESKKAMAKLFAKKDVQSSESTGFITPVTWADSGD